MKEGTIICVDDEKIILHGLETQLTRIFGDQYDYVMCESGPEAIEIVKETLLSDEEVIAIIADDVMPGMKGHELLSEVHRISPETCNILLTGESNARSVSYAVNHANLYRYITKPWEVDDLKLTLQEAVTKFFHNKITTDQKYKLELQSKILEDKIVDRRIELKEEREKSYELLLNILPKTVADELKEKGVIEPSHHALSSVLFTDFQGFTKAASKMTPLELLEDLNECFSAFDDISSRFNLEKIKTIGDAYLCVGGIPVENKTNPIDAVKAALEMKSWVNNWNKGRIENSKTPWEIRIGVHTGDVIAGVIGKNKFQYDIWGKTVYIASCMEKHGKIDEVSISEDTYLLVKDHFKCESNNEVDLKQYGKVRIFSVLGEIN